MTDSPLDPAKMETAFAEAMAKYGAPSTEHEMLAKREGRWKSSTKFWLVPNALWVAKTSSGHLLGVG